MSTKNIKDLKQLIGKMRTNGWSTEKGRNNIRWTHSSGAVIFSAATPSCRFAVKKIEGQLIRAERNATTNKRDTNGRKTTKV